MGNLANTSGSHADMPMGELSADVPSVGAAHSAHPAEPAHPAHPAHPAGPAHSAHPAEPAHPVGPAHSAHPAGPVHPAGQARFVRLCIEAITVFGVPAVLGACAVLHLEQTALLSMVVVTASLLLFFLGYEHGRPRLRDTMPVAVLAALAVAGRILFAPIPDFKPVSAIAIIAGAVFGRRNGFMVGALAALVSNFFFGQGPWTPWQMYAWGMVGYGAGLLAQAGLFERPAAVYAYGFAAPFGFGFIMNAWSILGFYGAQTAGQMLTLYALALPFDIVHAIATVVFLLALWKYGLH